MDLRMERHHKNGRLANFKTTPVYKRSTLSEGGELLRASCLELGRVVERDADQLSRSNLDLRKLFIEVAHAVDPGVHVSAKELGKAKRFGKSVIETGPILDLRGIDEDGFHGVANVEVTGAARLYRAASVWTAGLADPLFFLQNSEWLHFL